ncbi:apolipoprotein C-IV [Tachyglossus aculeatus]|uniref:apolipoprotein C-IV n=1 Tax=Tachyglossus aculeatus TaxID=9261 RepID=UPI0018F4C36A|nr:apolipoprotein C-IV [Tachyglossus aculeatus]
MSSFRHGLLLPWVLLLAWALGVWAGKSPMEEAAAEKAPAGTGWGIGSMVWGAVDHFVNPVVDKITTRENWTWIWAPAQSSLAPVGAFLATYYEDHLSDVGARTSQWLQSARQRAVGRARSLLCFPLLCQREGLKEGEGDKSKVEPTPPTTLNLTQET